MPAHVKLCILAARCPVLLSEMPLQPGRKLHLLGACLHPVVLHQKSSSRKGLESPDSRVESLRVEFTDQRPKFKSRPLVSCLILCKSLAFQSCLPIEDNSSNLLE